MAIRSSLGFVSLVLWSSVLNQVVWAESLPLSPGCRNLLSQPKLNFCFSQKVRAELKPLADYEYSMGEEGVAMGTRDLINDQKDQKILMSGLEALRFRLEVKNEQVEVLEKFCRSNQVSDCIGAVADGKSVLGSRPARGSYATGFEGDRKASMDLKVGRAACLSHDGKIEIKAALDGSGSASSVAFRRAKEGPAVQRLNINRDAHQMDELANAAPGSEDASMWANKDKSGRIKASMYFSDSDNAVAVAPGEEGQWKIVKSENGRVRLESEDTLITYVNVRAKSGRISKHSLASEIKKPARCTVEFERFPKATSSSQRTRLAQSQESSSAR